MRDNMNTSANPAANATALTLPRSGSYIDGTVLTVLKDKAPGSTPHAVLVKFTEHGHEFVGMLRGKEMNGSEDERKLRLDSIQRGDTLTAVVTSARFGQEGKPLLDLSERALIRLEYLQNLVQTSIVGKVVGTTLSGVLVDVGDAVGFLCTAELASANPRERLVQLQKGAELHVWVMSVDPDLQFGKHRIELSENEHYTRQTAKLANTDRDVVTGTVLRVGEGIIVSLQNGVEGFLPFGRIGTTESASLKKGVRTQVRVLGMTGRAVLLSREGFDSNRVRAIRASKLGDRRIRDQALRSSMQGKSGGSDKGGKKASSKK